MSFGIWQRTITDDAGNVLPGASIEVRAPSSNFTGALVSLFSDESGTTGLANPFNADSEGFAQFYAAPRKVDIRATGSGSQRTWRNVEILGTAATADKQTSPTDTTAGALMAVGAFGLGQTSGPNFVANIDDETLASGKYQFNQGNQGTYPRTGAGVLEVSVYRVDSSPFTTQTITYNESNGGNKYYRSYNNSTTSWSPWKELYHTGNILGTVSQSGGENTGAIIEKGGSDTAGEYTKFADGRIFMSRFYEKDLSELNRVEHAFPVTNLASGSSTFCWWCVHGSYSFSVGSSQLRAALSTLILRGDPSQWEMFQNEADTDPAFPITLFAMGRWY